MPTPGSDRPERSATDPLVERPAGFDEHWRSLRAELRRVEAWGRLLLAGGALLTVVGAGLFGLGVITYAGLGNPGYPWIVYAAVGSATCSLGGYIARMPGRQAGRLIRGKVVGYFGLGYRRNARAFPIDSFVRNGLLPAYSGRQLEDLVFGEVSGVPLVFCDARLTKPTGDDSKVVFRGPLVLSRFPKRAHGRTLVVPDGGTVGNFFRGLNDEHRRRVRMESPEFERAFAVWSTDQVEARYLLTPTVMERLLALQRRFPGRLTVAFAGHEFMLALDDRRDWFPDPGPFRRLTDPALVHQQAEDVARLTEIVAIVKLNLDSRA